MYACFGRCTGRDVPEPPNRFAKPVATKKEKTSIGYRSHGCDAEKFDKAFEKNDLQAYVGLMNSEQPIDSFEEKMHPWAEDPKTVGALAGTQLAIMASTAEKENPDVKDDIRNAGALPLFCEFIRSNRQDRVQAAIVALSFLTAENTKNCKCLYELGGIEILLPLMVVSKGGMRAAIATTLRNIAMESESYKSALLGVELKGVVVTISPTSSTDEQMFSCYNIGGEQVAQVPANLSDEEIKAHLARVLVTAPSLITILSSDGTSRDGQIIACHSNAMQLFVDMLSVTPDADPNLNNADLQLEAILNLQDFLEDYEGRKIDKHVQAAIRAGAVDQLRKLLTVDDADIRSSAEEVLELLEGN